MPKKAQKDGYSTVRVPEEFAAEMDKLIGTRGFTSRAEIVKEAVRELLTKYETEPLKMVNHDDKGVKVQDTKLRRVADIQITPKGIHCPVCDASYCEHIRFALNQPDVQQIIRKKQKEGWKIDLPDEA